MQHLLEVEHLSAAYGNIRVLHDVSLKVARSSVTALLGANGAGKTSMLRAATQSMVRTTGAISVGGQRVDGKATQTIARMGVAHVPDGRGTFNSLTTEENLRLGACARAEKSGLASDLEQVYSYFPRLKERRKQQAGTLSGGEQQMLAIGRALMSRPQLLLLDEPSVGLAPMIVDELFQIIRRVNQEQRVAILLVEQNATLALDVADAAYVMETGRIVLEGTPTALRDNEEVRRIYLGA